MAITMRAGATANGINFNTYFTTYLAKSGSDDHGGNPTFYGGSTQFEGDQLALSYTKDRLILAEGDDLNYTLATHVLAGELDTLKFGTYGDNYSIDGDGELTGTVTEVEVSGLDLHSAPGVKGDVHDIIYGFMSSDASPFLDYISSQAQIVYGSKGNDTYSGTKFNDKAFGYEGNDTFNGGAGNDTLDGGAGNDKLIGGDGNDGLVGGDGKDALQGGKGNDTLTGGTGKDTLFGGAGKDKLTGGTGADTFKYASVDDSLANKKFRDAITDFNAKENDVLNLKLVDANENKKGNQAFSFEGQTKFSKTAGELIYKIDGKHTYVMGDTDGDGKADFSIDLTGKHKLVADDFLL